MRMDVRPFREHRDFRLLLIAGTVFYFGGMMTYVAIPYQIYQLTGDRIDPPRVDDPNGEAGLANPRRRSQHLVCERSD